MNTIQSTLSTTWFGKCIFISWYCETASCKFCFRAYQNAKVKKTPEQAKRSMASILAEAFIAKQLGWRIEFLTGGCNSYAFEELLEIIKNVCIVYGEKIWINLGLFDEKKLEQLKPYVEGICASIETTASELHDEICPDKPIKPYEEMLQSLNGFGFKKSACIIIGLGETKKDIDSLFEFIEKNKLDRITFYALKPVKGSGFDKSPEPEYYAWWIAQTRKRFPELEIMAGLTPKNPEYAEWVLKAGASAVTKFPAIRKFNSKEARIVEQGIKKAGREFKGTLTKLPDVDWDEEVDKLDDKLGFDKELKEKIKVKLRDYLKKMKSNT
ncbi:radical SAM protein [Candidatus Woesearchaeota archaeon]|nr:radical SAM protein [Candidatus Woesearchaeota archaeon]